MVTKLNTIGERGLVIFYDKFYYVEEKNWRIEDNEILEGPKLQKLTGLLELRTVVAKLEQEVFVDIDGFSPPDRDRDTRPGSHEESPAKTPLNPNPPAKPCSILVHEREYETGKHHFYDVKSDYWQELVPVGMEGDAGVLIRRGAIIASIPQNAIPFGTYCILVDAAHILNPGDPNGRQHTPR